MVTSAASPSAPRAAAAKLVAIEKNTTVPPSAVARMAGCSHPGTSTQTTVTSAGPPAPADRFGQAEGCTRIGDNDLVGEVRGTQGGGFGLVRDDADEPSGARVPSGGQGERPDLPAAPSTQTVGPSHTSSTTRAHQGRGAADVHDHESEPRVEVVREDGGDRPAEEDRVTAGRDLFAAPVPSLEPVGDAQWRQRERHERGHPVPHREAERALRSDLGDRAHEHAARPGDRVLHLAAGRDDVEDLGPDRVAVTVVLLGQLAVPTPRRG